MKNIDIICCKLFSIFGFSEKGKMQPRANTFHHLSFITKMTKTCWLGNIKGNMMGCRILLIVVKSREISSKGKGKVPNGKFLRLFKNEVFTKLSPGGSFWDKTWSTFGIFSHTLCKVQKSFIIASTLLHSQWQLDREGLQKKNQDSGDNDCKSLFQKKTQYCSIIKTRGHAWQPKLPVARGSGRPGVTSDRLLCKEQWVTFFFWIRKY